VEYLKSLPSEEESDTSAVQWLGLSCGRTGRRPVLTWQAETACVLEEIR